MQGRKIAYILLILFSYLNTKCQLTKLDSLQFVIKNAKNDSAAIDGYRNLFYYYHERDIYSKHKYIGEKVLELGEKNNNNYWKGFGNRVLGDHFHSLQKNEEALKKYLISIDYLEKTKEYLSLTSAYTNLGNVYYDVYGPDKAVVYFKKALGILKRHNINDISTITNLNNNLGICAASTHNFSLAKFYFQNSLTYWIKDKDSISMGKGYNNLANLFREMKEMDSAKLYFKKALDLKLKFSNKDDMVDAYSNYGTAFFETKNYVEALSQFKAGEKYIDTTENYTDTRWLFINIAETYERLKDYKNAYKYLSKANKLITKKNVELGQLSFKSTNVAYSDSLINVNEKQIQDLMIEKQNSQLETGKQQKIFLSIGLAIVLFGGILFYNRYKITKKQKEVIEEQKHLVEGQNKEISHQKVLVEEKQKEIIDSITYANRIQNAVLTNDSVWQKISEQHFVLFIPKDIVSGDFYWAYETPNNKSIWAVADCTGHGVPGAFMSMLGNSLLNEIVIENKIYKPSEILDRLRSKIIAALTKENVNQNDGMDIALCVWDKANNELEFAGANNGALIIRDNNFQELNGDKMPVGKYHGDDKPFTSTTFKLQKNDFIYLYTDGYADQFGGPAGKKFRYKQLDELILSIKEKDMSQQAKLLEERFLTWKGSLIQTDDICIVGIKILT